MALEANKKVNEIVAKIIREFWQVCSENKSSKLPRATILKVFKIHFEQQRTWDMIKCFC
jgi:hypothetical protein